MKHTTPLTYKSKSDSECIVEAIKIPNQRTEPMIYELAAHLNYNYTPKFVVTSNHIRIDYFSNKNDRNTHLQFQHREYLVIEFDNYRLESWDKFEDEYELTDESKKLLKLKKTSSRFADIRPDPNLSDSFDRGLV